MYRNIPLKMSIRNLSLLQGGIVVGVDLDPLLEHPKKRYWEKLVVVGVDLLLEVVHLYHPPNRIEVVPYHFNVKVLVVVLVLVLVLLLTQKLVERGENHLTLPSI